MAGIEKEAALSEVGGMAVISGTLCGSDARSVSVNPLPSPEKIA